MSTSDVHDDLAPRAFLHDDPESYLAGVDDALAAAGSVLRQQEPEESPA